MDFVLRSHPSSSPTFIQLWEWVFGKSTKAICGTRYPRR